MKPHSTSNQNLPENDPSRPNDDGCILGTADRDEDPNATTDRDHEVDSADNGLTPEDARGLPGYPNDSKMIRCNQYRRHGNWTMNRKSVPKHWHRTTTVRIE
jgi:hypothetical protein